MIIGGGPSGFMKAKKLYNLGKTVVLVADQFGGAMKCVGSRRLQSFRNELELKYADTKLDQYINGQSLSPLATEYVNYVTACINQLPIKVILGHVSFIERGADGFVCRMQCPEGELALKSKNLILATGTSPRPIPPFLYGLSVMRCFEAYEYLRMKNQKDFSFDNVVIIGSGNSAFQLALSCIELGIRVTILARHYYGLFPQETHNRFALRAASQPAIEYIWKSQEGTDLIPAAFHIYSQIIRYDDGLDVVLRRDKNKKHIAERSYINLFDGEVLEQKNVQYDAKNTLFISAIGTVGNIPANNLAMLRVNKHGFVNNVDGKTRLEALYVAGSLAGARSVNTMWNDRN